MLKIMRTRTPIFLLCISIVAIFIVPLFVQASSPFRIAQVGIGPLPTISSLAPNIYQTALKAGDRNQQITINVQSFISVPIISADLSQIGFSSPTTTPLSGTNNPYHYYINGVDYFPDWFYKFWPLTIGADVTDGLKTISITATDAAGNIATGTAQVLIDNILPTLSLTDISFSTTSPKKGDTMYLSGTASGTGSPLTVYNIWETIWDAKGKPIWGAGFGTSYKGTALTSAIATSTNGTFTRVPYTIIDSVPSGISTATTVKIDITAYDGSGHIVTTSLTVPVPKAPPPDPCAVPGACASNVLFLPGIEASRLYRPDGNGSDKKLWEPGGDADAMQIAMTTTGSSARSDIYTRDVIDNAYLPIKGNVYKSFLEQLASMKAGHTIADYTVAPYDWRLSLDDILTKGKQTGTHISYLDATSSPYIIQELRRLAKSSKTGKVTIVAHSNGGLVAKRLTELLGPDAATFIDKMILVAVPQAGTPQAVGAILHGYNQSLPIKPLSLFGMTEATARELARNMPSVYNLLPSASYFTYADDPVVTISADPLLAPWRTAYAPDGIIHSSERLRDFMVDESRAALPASDPLTAPIVGNGALLNASDILHNTLDAWVPPAGIALTEIAGWGEETLKTIAYYQGTKSSCTAFKADSTCAAMISTPALQYSPKTVLDGDGTVVVPSALWTPSATGVQKYWVDLRDYNKWWFNGNIPRKHADILEISELRSFIQNIITNVNLNPLPEHILTSSPPNTDQETILHFTLHSPLTLNLYDKEGHHTGFSTTTNSLEENIPGSRYLSFGEVQYISVPSSANLNLIMDGYADGSFTFDIEEAQGGTVIATTTFSGIPSFTNTKVTMDIPENAGIDGASDLRMDVQGDGTVDVELEPKLNGTVILPMPLTVTAENKKITLGEPIPFLTAHISDALANAVVDDITGAPDCTTTATATSPAGEYPITCSLGTLLSEKYEFTTFIPGTLTIQYRWGGFLQPIKDTAHQVGQSASVFKGGSTVPVKFQLKDVNGTPIQATTAPVWLSPQAGMSDGVYKWDSFAQQYVYNWSTKGLTTGLYKIFAKLDDGNTYYTAVGLK